jgi:hypothetical protein
MNAQDWIYFACGIWVGGLIVIVCIYIKWFADEVMKGAKKT